MADEQWPSLRYDDWKDTYLTLHLWSQVVGKVALALAPPLNHSWGVAMQVTPRGLMTRALKHGNRTFTMEFDFIDHVLQIRASDGAVRSIVLAPRTVADFYADVMRTLREMALPVKIWPVSTEMATAIRIDTDVEHHIYVPEQANRFWRVLVNVERVLSDARCSFIGKASPAHFFWGGFDLALSRFSGRPAPPREGPVFMQEAYSQEVISHGFWPGSMQVLEASFYAYAVPEPDGLKDARVEPDAAYYHREMGEFILPYEAVRTSADPAAAIRRFIDTTYAQAATLGRWDRAALERSA